MAKELKAFKMFYDDKNKKKVGDDYYLKSEADKVIADKDKEIEELKVKNAQLEDDVAFWKTKQRWRKCSDELPKLEDGVGEIFLVAVETESDTHPKSSYVTTAEFCEGEWYNDSTGNELEENIDREDCFYHSKVTHWMPLPKEPEDK